MRCWKISRVRTIAVVLVTLTALIPQLALGQHTGGCFAPTASGPLDGRTIVVDPGHGGSDPGAVNDGLHEKELNLRIAQRLRTLLTAQGADVCLTRTTDETLSNNDRYTFANAVGGDALVSLHLNASSDTSVDYTMTMWGKRRKDKALAETVLPHLLAKLAATPDGQDTPIDSGRVGQFASGVLLKSDMPAIIVEAVFLSNSWEAAAFQEGINDGTYWREAQIADAVRDGLVAFFAETTSSSDPGPPGQANK